jgi:hypothetical protein
LRFGRFGVGVPASGRGCGSETGLSRYIRDLRFVHEKIAMGSDSASLFRSPQPPWPSVRPRRRRRARRSPR